MTTPAIEGWFTTGSEPALLGSTCTECGNIAFPPEREFCKNPTCSGESFEVTELSRHGTVWSYTDAQYQPPAPYVPVSDPYEPFALAAVELPEGLVVLGQLAAGVGVADVKVGSPVELVVEPIYTDEVGERTMWKWRPTEAPGFETGASAPSSTNGGGAGAPSSTNGGGAGAPSSTNGGGAGAPSSTHGGATNGGASDGGQA